MTVSKMILMVVVMVISAVANSDSYTSDMDSHAYGYYYHEHRADYDVSNDKEFGEPVRIEGVSYRYDMNRLYSKGTIVGSIERNRKGVIIANISGRGKFTDDEQQIEHKLEKEKKAWFIFGDKYPESLKEDIICYIENELKLDFESTDGKAKVYLYTNPKIK